MNTKRNQIADVKNYDFVLVSDAPLMSRTIDAEKTGKKYQLLY